MQLSSLSCDPCCMYTCCYCEHQQGCCCTKSALQVLITAVAVAVIIYGELHSKLELALQGRNFDAAAAGIVIVNAEIALDMAIWGVQIFTVVADGVLVLQHPAATVRIAMLLLWLLARLSWLWQQLLLLPVLTCWCCINQNTFATINMMLHAWSMAILTAIGSKQTLQLLGCPNGCCCCCYKSSRLEIML